MSFLDPKTSQWYQDPASVPAGTVVYNPDSKSYVTVSPNNQQMSPWSQSGDGWTYDPGVPESIQTGYNLNPAQAPEGAKDPSNIIDPYMADSHRLASQLVAAQFAEWEQTFKPIELQDLQNLSFNNPKILPEAVEKARGAAAGTSGAMSGILERQNRALGVNPTSDQNKASGRILDINRATMTAGAENKARENVSAQDTQILMGTAPNPNITRVLSQQQ